MPSWKSHAFQPTWRYLPEKLSIPFQEPECSLAFLEHVQIRQNQPFWCVATLSTWSLGKWYLCPYQWIRNWCSHAGHAGHLKCPARVGKLKSEWLWPLLEQKGLWNLGKQKACAEGLLVLSWQQGATQHLQMPLVLRARGFQSQMNAHKDDGRRTPPKKKLNCWKWEIS